MNHRISAFLRVTLLIGCLSFLVVPIVDAQEQTPAWRQNLDCPDDLKNFKGIEYCKSKNGEPLTVHVIVIDLYDPSPRLEYIIAEGKDRDGKFGECQDVNIPIWSTKGPGCRDPNDVTLYPVMPFNTAVKRAEDKGAVVVINGDYSACTTSKKDCERRKLEYRSHGPEGLTVVHGNRLDGPDVGDTDNNAVNRPWLAIAREYAFHPDISTKKLRAEIHKLKSDSGALPYDWIWSGMGGAPWLVRNGEVKKKEIDDCQGAAGSCYDKASQTAVGLTKDGRWMFLVLGDKPPTLLDLANFMHDKLEVDQAIKLDGGGSTQLWYSSAGQPYILTGDGRSLTNYLAVIAKPGNGINIGSPPSPPGPPIPPDQPGFWESIRQILEKMFQDLWARLTEFFDRWWQEQSKQLEKQFNEWLETQAQRLLEQIARGLQEALGQCLGAALIPAGAVVWLWAARKRTR